MAQNWNQLKKILSSWMNKLQSVHKVAWHSEMQKKKKSYEVMSETERHIAKWDNYV